MSKLTFHLVILLLLCMLSLSTAWWWPKWGHKKHKCHAVHCNWAAWGAYGLCSASCGRGTQYRNRGIARQASCGGSGCHGSSRSSRSCNQRCCPVNCKLGPWKKVGACSATCGGGMQRRWRDVVVLNKCGGTPCANKDDKQPCNTQCCPVNCKLGPWKKVGGCSATCGGGMQRRWRDVVVLNKCGGTPCSNKDDKQPCNTQCCPVNCKLGPWKKVGSCSATCGGGMQRRKRDVVVSDKCGGTPCSNKDKMNTMPCNTQCCPVNCKLGPWKKIGSCSATCGGGMQRRKRDVVVLNKCGGTPCANKDDTQPCNTQCCPVNCKLGPWKKIGGCSATCGGGMQRRKRDVVVLNKCGGTPCSNKNKMDTMPCNTQCCPVDCRWVSWSDFTFCSASCGGGTKKRTRSIKSKAVCGGSECLGKSKETKTCNQQNCPIDCLWSDWSEWGECTVTCGGGKETRTRKIKVMEQYGGQKCQGDDSQTRNCNEICCAVDCIWGDWSLWTACSKSCEKGSQTRQRKILTPQTCGGKKCSGKFTEERICNDLCCPVDCGYSEWSDWGSCSKTCGVGIQRRRRTVVREPFCGGNNCRADLVEERECNAGCCPVNCKVTKWGDWAKCSSSCGSNGVQKRTRSVAIRPQCNGTPCPENTEEMQPCNRICLNGGKLNSYQNCLCSAGWSGTCCEKEIDLCKKEKDKCHEMATCKGTPGSYICTCMEGFTGDGVTCKDINECESGQYCNGPFMSCENTYGSYACYCQRSLQLVDGQCIEIEEQIP